jgi:hypothetical protein
MREREFGGEAGDAGSHGSDSYPAKSPAQREAEQKRAQGRHAGAFSLEEIGRKVPRGTNVEHPALKPGRVTPC